MTEGPPLGIMPKWVWLEKRKKELREAIERYMISLYPVPEEWVDEYNELIRIINKSKGDKS